MLIVAIVIGAVMMKRRARRNTILMQPLGAEGRRGAIVFVSAPHLSF